MVLLRARCHCSDFPNSMRARSDDDKLTYSESCAIGQLVYGTFGAQPAPEKCIGPSPQRTRLRMTGERDCKLFFVRELSVRRGCHLDSPDAIIVRVGDEQITGSIHGHSLW